MIRLQNISKQHGRQILFLDATCDVFRGEKVGLVGPNGSGKSTIFRMIVGDEEPDVGQVAHPVLQRDVRREVGDDAVLDHDVVAAGEELHADAGPVQERGVEVRRVRVAGAGGEPDTEDRQVVDPTTDPAELRAYVENLEPGAREALLPYAGELLQLLSARGS